MRKGVGEIEGRLQRMSRHWGRGRLGSDPLEPQKASILRFSQNPSLPGHRAEPLPWATTRHSEDFLGCRWGHLPEWVKSRSEVSQTDTEAVWEGKALNGEKTHRLLLSTASRLSPFYPFSPSPWPPPSPPASGYIGPVGRSEHKSSCRSLEGQTLRPFVNHR